MPSGQRWLVAAVLAALLWSLLFFSLPRLLRRDGSVSDTRAAAMAAAKERAVRRPRRVSARLAPPSQRDVAASPVTPRPPEKEKKRDKPKEIEVLDRQIVETARPESEAVPERARYLGRYDMKVEREQKSVGRQRKERDLGTTAIETPSELQSPTAKSKDKTTLPQAAKAARAKQAAERKAEKAPPSSPSSTVAAVDKPTPAAIAPLTDGPGAAPGGAEPKTSTRSPVVRGGHSDMLLPATSHANVMHNLQALAGSPGSDDYLPDVEEEGATNLLNTRKFRYWDFFQRVRERVRREWNPSDVWRSRDPTGKRYGVRDRLTVVRVTLDPEGTVKALRVHKESGLSFLDDEASRAFVAAGPYPNPPAGLLNERGEVEFQFGFMFEISSSRFHFYRMDR